MRLLMPKPQLPMTTSSENTKDPLFNIWNDKEIKSFLEDDETCTTETDSCPSSPDSLDDFTISSEPLENIDLLFDGEFDDSLLLLASHDPLTSDTSSSASSNSLNGSDGSSDESFLNDSVKDITNSPPLLKYPLIVSSGNPLTTREIMPPATRDHPRPTRLAISSTLIPPA